MLVTAIEIDCRHGKSAEIVFCGDDHIGSANFVRSAQQRVIKYIQTSGCLWVHMGDGIDAIAKRDIRYDFRTADKKLCSDPDLFLQKQIEAFSVSYAPITDNLIAMLDGNHPDKLRRIYGIDPYYEMHRNLKPENPSYKRLHGHHALGTDGWIILHLRTTRTRVHSISLYVHHGWFSSRTHGAKVNNLQRLMLGMDADIIAVGHGHTVEVMRDQPINITGGYDIKHRHRIGFMCGTFLKTYSANQAESYSGRLGYQPAYLGAVKLTIDPTVFKSSHGMIPWQLETI